MRLTVLASASYIVHIDRERERDNFLWTNMWGTSLQSWWAFDGSLVQTLGNNNQNIVCLVANINLITQTEYA